ncbi:unnamed protein product [Rangifer tarandus platyrhynchus]|uniref:Uncharacterized protein n=1 Tax=Rangifer tarandus platyrhynchus TaxID=3082113 RepID=A0ABN8XM74_RANTA|nr:unnamed protein product [Rangifer tarandus platyrhynchus]
MLKKVCVLSRAVQNVIQIAPGRCLDSARVCRQAREKFSHLNCEGGTLSRQRTSTLYRTRMRGLAPTLVVALRRAGQASHCELDKSTDASFLGRATSMDASVAAPRLQIRPDRFCAHSRLNILLCCWRCCRLEQDGTDQMLSFRSDTHSRQGFRHNVVQFTAWFQAHGVARAFVDPAGKDE